MSSFWEKLHISRWNECSVKERLEALQKLEEHEANRQGRTHCPVEITEDPTVYGSFLPIEGIIKINIDLLRENQCYEAVNTILHEGRHAYQYHVIEKEPREPVELVNQWSKNMLAYFRNDPDYMLQPVEWDTHHYALKRSKEIYQELEAKYGKNTGYKEYEEKNIIDINDQKIEAKNIYQEDYMQTIQFKVDKYYELILQVLDKYKEHCNSLFDEMESFIHDYYKSDTSLNRFESYLESEYLKGRSLSEYIEYKQQTGQLNPRRFFPGSKIEELIKLIHVRKEISQQKAGHVNPSKFDQASKQDRNNHYRDVLKEQVELNNQFSQAKDPISRERTASDELTQIVLQSLAIDKGIER